MGTSIGIGLSLSRLSGGAGAWTPAGLPGLAAWYTASPLYCFTDAGASVRCGDGDPIRTWADRSGNGYTLSQATLAYRPILYSLGGGLYVATFDGVDDFMSSAYQPTRPHTCAVAADVPPGGMGTIHDFSAGNKARLFTGGATLNWFSNAYIAAQDSVLLPSGRFVSICGYGSSGSFVRLDGVSYATAAQAASDPTGSLSLAAYGNQAADFIAVDLYEAVFATGFIGGSDLSYLETYLGV